MCLAVHLNSLMTLPFPSQQGSDFAAAATAPNLSAACFAGAQSTDICGHNSRRTRTPLLKETRATRCPSTAFTAVGDVWLDCCVPLLPTASPTSSSMLCNGLEAESQTGNRMNVFCTFPGVSPLVRVLLRSEIETATLTGGFSGEEGNN